MKNYFTLAEKLLWGISVILIILSFAVFDRENVLTLVASLVGVTSLIFNAKGNPIGQALMIVFSILYGIISFEFAYYGEMLTYVGMTAPMACAALISWIKNPFEGEKREVKVNKISFKETVFMFVLGLIVTFGFYFILEHFNTANIVPSTISVTTSFVAVYLTFRRSAYASLGYMANDGVLLVLWTLAAFEDISYISVIVCFAVFAVNDCYGFISWRKMQKRQAEKITSFSIAELQE